MLEDVLGSKLFFKGLQNYLNKYKFSNAETNDLWQCLTDEVKVHMNSPVLEIPCVTIVCSICFVSVDACGREKVAKMGLVKGLAWIAWYSEANRGKKFALAKG